MMPEALPTRCIMTYVIVNIVALQMLLNYLLCADGLVWIKQPNASTPGQKGSNISMKWQYKIEKNERFSWSRCFKNEPRYDLASRLQGEDRYGLQVHPGKILPISISGTDDVTLTVHKTEFSNSGEYCCEVTVKPINQTIKVKDKKCTNLFIYDLPRITYHTPKLSCKQGDSVKLQCNATGHPEPRVEWIHRDTKKIIAHSSVTSLYITGKRSEGSYCCHVTNRFGNATNCTSAVKVTEYGPLKTVLSSLHKKYAVRNMVLKIRCRAKAYPSPVYFLIEIEKKHYNSSNGILIFNVTAATPDIAISCIPWNKYGRGPMKKIILPVYDPPRFTDMRTRYNMTIKSIKITFSATGNPKPDITWTKGDTGEIVSTKAYYEVPYVKCANNTLTFYCHVSNILGSINSTAIQVHVMTKLNCSSLPKDLEETVTLSYIFISLGIILLLVIIITIPMICYWKKIKERKSSKAEEHDQTDQELLEMHGSFNQHEV